MRHGVPLLALLWAACDAATTPTAGELVVRFSTPHVDDRAVQVRVQCPQPPLAVRAAAGYLAYVDSGAAALTLIVVRQGGQFIAAEADVATIAVSDVNQTCTARLLSVAFQGYGLRPSLTGYRIAVSQR